MNQNDPRPLDKPSVPAASIHTTNMTVTGFPGAIMCQIHGVPVTLHGRAGEPWRIDCPECSALTAVEPAPMGTREQYLADQLHILNPAVGVARLALKQGDPQKALKWLDEAVEQIDALASPTAAGGVTGPERARLCPNCNHCIECGLGHGTHIELCMKDERAAAAEQPRTVERSPGEEAYAVERDRIAKLIVLAMRQTGGEWEVARRAADAILEMLAAPEGSPVASEEA